MINCCTSNIDNDFSYQESTVLLFLTDLDMITNYYNNKGCMEYITIIMNSKHRHSYTDVEKKTRVKSE